MQLSPVVDRLSGKNKIVDIVHADFIYIFLPQYLMYDLINVLLLKVVHLCVCLGALDSHTRNDCWHLCVREGRRCLGHYSWLTAIALGCRKILLQISHFPDKLGRVSWSKLKYLSL